MNKAITILTPSLLLSTPLCHSHPLSLSLCLSVSHTLSLCIFSPFPLSPSLPPLSERLRRGPPEFIFRGGGDSFRRGIHTVPASLRVCFYTLRNIDPGRETGPAKTNKALQHRLSQRASPVARANALTPVARANALTLVARANALTPVRSRAFTAYLLKKGTRVTLPYFILIYCSYLGY